MVNIKPLRVIRAVFFVDFKNKLNETLKLNKEVIEKAKAYAELQKTSLSSMIESYLNSLVNEKDLLSEKDQRLKTQDIRFLQLSIPYPIKRLSKKVSLFNSF